MTIKVERLKNFIEFITNLSMNNYYGDIKLKLDNGTITIAEKIDKIKFDNSSYSGYKNKNSN